ncbi:hypothetical protein [Myxococcus qinghaiensis]|uniref:hypothetical protein n=1 Tax=Myxococcus qinghaiensis TaxID=2906758 RepID=UPI0020A81A0B|nr:hypothetical protein [Myxococcus qinghaiensis]MCP3169458.1 hypothetical protein [Myxococcus qinghaiensis]
MRRSLSAGRVYLLLLAVVARVPTRRRLVALTRRALVLRVRDTVRFFRGVIVRVRVEARVFFLATIKSPSQSLDCAPQLGTARVARNRPGRRPARDAEGLLPPLP